MKKKSKKNDLVFESKRQVIFTETPSHFLEDDLEFFFTLSSQQLNVIIHRQNGVLYEYIFYNLRKFFFRGSCFSMQDAVLSLRLGDEQKGQGVCAFIFKHTPRKITARMILKFLKEGSETCFAIKTFFKRWNFLPKSTHLLNEPQN